MNVMNYATRDVLTVAPSDSIDEAISLMEEREVHHLVVVRNGRAVGVVSDRDILISTGWMFAIERRSAPREAGSGGVIGPTRVEQIMSRPIVGLDPTGGAREAAQRMVERKIGAVPILRDGGVVGLVTETDLLRWLDELALGDARVAAFLQTPVRERIPAHIVWAAPDAPLEDVIDIFRRFRVRHVPVADRQRTLLGIISDRDVRRALGWSSARDMQAEDEGRLTDVEHPSTAAEIMQKEVVTITPNEPLRTPLRRMLERRIHSLPVVEGQTVVGIVSATDFTKAIAHEGLL